MKHLTLSLLLLLAAAPALAQTSVPAQTAAAESEDARLNAFFEQAFQARIALSPQQMTSLGIKTDYDKLDDVTDAAAERSLALAEIGGLERPAPVFFWQREGAAVPTGIEYGPTAPCHCPKSGTQHAH